ncbi:hypothetical protein YC2023_043582 [Brassica napus]
MSSFTLGSLAGLKENQKEQRHDDNVFAIYPHMDGRGTATGGQFKDDDSPAGYMLLPCSGCNTRTSREVTHPNTTLAQARLTEEF